MIITPARFEDKMKEAETLGDALAIMLNTLESMGYEAGVDVWMNKFMYKDLLHGKNNDH